MKMWQIMSKSPSWKSSSRTETFRQTRQSAILGTQRLDQQPAALLKSMLTRKVPWEVLCCRQVPSELLKTRSNPHWCFCRRGGVRDLRDGKDTGEAKELSQG